MKLAAAQGVGVGTVERIKAALASRRRADNLLLRPLRDLQAHPQPDTSRDLSLSHLSVTFGDQGSHDTSTVRERFHEGEGDIGCEDCGGGRSFFGDPCLAHAFEQTL